MKTLLAARAGNFGMFAALLAIPVVAALGVAVDFGTSMSRKAEVQNAADAAVLAVAAMKTGSDSQMVAEGRRVFLGNLPPAVAAMTVIEELKLSADNLVTLKARVAVPLTLSRMIQSKPIDVRVVAQAIRALEQLLEVVLVLDNTYSMSGKKLADLKKAANRLLDIFEQTGKSTLMVGIVPFSNYVNVGLSHRKDSWLTVPDDFSRTENICRNTVTSKSGCRKVPSVRDGIDTGGTVEKCDSYTTTRTCGDEQRSYRWSGCVGSRSYPLDVHDIKPERRYTGLLNISCGAPMLPLTNDYKKLRAAVSSMVANNDTYIPAGILWGWNLLSSALPFDESASLPTGGKQAMIVMTDGANTLSPGTGTNYVYHNGNKADQADRLMGEVCRNAKDDGVTVYTVAVGVAPEAVAKLASCASDEGKAFSVERSDELIGVFQNMASSIISPRLTR
ncbi:hypothetical protein BJF93_23555 [Xaviernesmea oryzae]|uniref:VWFA domain-containing protein n=1 Tax=Xaviernesmea oryzae TaxID=464029 RepID=A0A1Q9B2U5_9HYPH|nr:pilus assembly protein TadG-related protein [Xaviernesmea oryzae]OLP62338.1 hypothetical protein BJF93_23555 [Xaviernesmea oryzae]